jgi:hypothetical protein
LTRIFVETTSFCGEPIVPRDAHCVHTDVCQSTPLHVWGLAKMAEFVLLACCRHHSLFSILDTPLCARTHFVRGPSVKRAAAAVIVPNRAKMTSAGKPPLKSNDALCEHLRATCAGLPASVVNAFRLVDRALFLPTTSGRQLGKLRASLSQ